VLTAYRGAKELLNKKINLLHSMAQMLLEKETIESEDIEELIKQIDKEAVTA